MRADIALVHQIATETERSALAEYRTLRRMEKVFEAALGLSEGQKNGNLTNTDLTNAEAAKRQAALNEGEVSRSVTKQPKNVDIKNGFGYNINPKGIYTNDKKEYVTLARAVNEKYVLNRRKTDYAYTANYFYVVKVQKFGSFIPIAQIHIDSYPDFIIKITKEIENGTFRNAKTLDKWAEIIQDGERGDNHHNDSVTGGGSDELFDAFHDKSSGSESGGYSRRGGKHSGKVKNGGVSRSVTATSTANAVSSRIVFGTPAVTNGSVKEKAKGAVEKVKGFIIDKGQRRDAREKFREAMESLSIYAENSFAAVENQLRRMAKDGAWDGMEN